MMDPQLRNRAVLPGMTIVMLLLVAGCRREQPERVASLQTHERTAAELPPPQARAGRVWVDPVDHAATGVWN